MKAILEIINSAQLPSDKANHFIVGLYIFMLFGVIFGTVAGLAAAIFAAILKEIYDALSEKGTPEVWDALATAAGGVAGFLCSVM